MLPFELHICLLLFKVNSDNEVFRKDVWNLFRAIQINRERVKSKNSLRQPICRSNYWLPAAATRQADRLLSVCILIPISSITVQSELRLWGVQKRCSESLHSNLEQWKSNYVEKAFYGNRSAGEATGCRLRQPVCQTKSVATYHHTSHADFYFGQLNYGPVFRSFL